MPGVEPVAYVWCEAVHDRGAFVPPAPGSTGQLVYDVDAQVGPLDVATGLPPQDTTQFFTAIGTLQFLVSQYPFLETAGDFPPDLATNPQYADLLIAFSAFVAKYNLQILGRTVFNGLIFNGGVGSLEKLTTLYALLNLRLGILNLQTPGAACIPVGGCQAFYDGIKAFLGDAVYLNAQVMSVQRPESRRRKLQPLASLQKQEGG
jgi:hypothetical protein